MVMFLISALTLHLEVHRLLEERRLLEGSAYFNVMSKDAILEELLYPQRFILDEFA